MHTCPALRVGLPATAQDAYSMTLSAIACDDPTLVIENRGLYHIIAQTGRDWRADRCPLAGAAVLPARVGSHDSHLGLDALSGAGCSGEAGRAKMSQRK
jgi:pyruvate/2-oxoglutarate/acetoin dehydrogenase E1 component